MRSSVWAAGQYQHIGLMPAELLAFVLWLADANYITLDVRLGESHG